MIPLRAALAYALGRVHIDRIARPPHGRLYQVRARVNGRYVQYDETDGWFCDCPDGQDGDCWHTDALEAVL